MSEYSEEEFVSSRDYITIDEILGGGLFDEIIDKVGSEDTTETLNNEHSESEHSKSEHSESEHAESDNEFIDDKQDKQQSDEEQQSDNEFIDDKQDKDEHHSDDEFIATNKKKKPHKKKQIGGIFYDSDDVNDENTLGGLAKIIIEKYV